MTCLNSLSNPLEELRLQLPSPHAQASALPNCNTASPHQTTEVGCTRELVWWEQITAHRLRNGVVTFVIFLMYIALLLTWECLSVTYINRQIIHVKSCQPLFSLNNMHDRNFSLLYQLWRSPGSIFWLQLLHDHSQDESDRHVTLRQSDFILAIVNTFCPWIYLNTFMEISHSEVVGLKTDRQTQRWDADHSIILNILQICSYVYSRHLLHCLEIKATSEMWPFLQHIFQKDLQGSTELKLS